MALFPDEENEPQNYSRFKIAKWKFTTGKGVGMGSEQISNI